LVLSSTIVLRRSPFKIGQENGNIIIGQVLARCELVLDKDNGE
jgi:hypothetical protein